MKHIVFDCDNTMGIQGCDVDDGLALLYLLGKERERRVADYDEDSVRLEGIVTTYGNSELEKVHRNTERVLDELKRMDLPLVKGRSSKDDRSMEAGAFLSEMAKKYPGNLRILATGSLSNLLAAYEMDPEFFERVEEIVLMGGITEPLLVGGKVMNELNFSCDPTAVLTVLTKGRHVSVITGNNCLKAYFNHDEYRQRLMSGGEKGRYIYEKTAYWFDTMRAQYDFDGFYNWDVVAAAYLMEKRFFQDSAYEFNGIAADLKTGYIGKKTEKCADGPIAANSDTCEGVCCGETVINLPEIRDFNGFKEDIYRCWLADEVRGAS